MKVENEMRWVEMMRWELGSRSCDDEVKWKSEMRPADDAVRSHAPSPSPSPRALSQATPPPFISISFNSIFYLIFSFNSFHIFNFQIQFNFYLIFSFNWIWYLIFLFDYILKFILKFNSIFDLTAHRQSHLLTEIVVTFGFFQFNGRRRRPTSWAESERNETPASFIVLFFFYKKWIKEKKRKSKFPVGRIFNSINLVT